LRQAEVVLYDRLVAAELLDEAPASALLIDVGKAPDRAGPKIPRSGLLGSWDQAQDDINALLIAHARAGRTVVRLKGGDPFVFGRGGEEALALAAAGLPFEIVPGVSSALAAPAYAGIAVTHRGLAQSFTVVTGHTADGDDPRWDDLPRSGTLVLLMGVRHLPAITARLIAAGRPPATPAAVIHWGTTTQQVVVDGTLADIAERARGVPPPATVVIGEVVALRKRLSWFTPNLVVATPAGLAGADLNPDLSIQQASGSHLSPPARAREFLLRPSSAAEPAHA
jgi:uroporphyrin-III C-methyltransferase